MNSNTMTNTSIDLSKWNHLFTQVELECLEDYIKNILGKVGDSILSIWLFGSAAENKRWKIPTLRSDIDILILTKDEISRNSVDNMINDTYELFLKCGTQISPSFISIDEWNYPKRINPEIVKRIKGKALLLWENKEYSASYKF